MICYLLTLIKAETDVSWANDLSTVNLSLFEPLSLGSDRLETLRNLSLNVSNLELESKVSAEGGAFRYISPQIVMSIRNMSAKSCKSTSSGGSFYIESTNILHFDNCSFWNSSSISSGGSIYVTTTNLVLLNGSIFNMTQGQYGGSLYIKGRINVTNSWFEKSEASVSGGSIFINGLVNDKAYPINNCFFGECKCAQGGGAIFISSSENIKTEIMDCTFYLCSSSNGNGGAVYIASQGQSIRCELKRICFSRCFINSTSYLGTSVYILSSSNDLLLSFDMVSCSCCGIIGYSQGTLSLYYGQQSINALNISKCISAQSSGFCFYPYISSTYLYINLLNCSSSANDVIYSSSTSQTIDMVYINVLSNSATNIISFYSNLYKYTFKFSVLIGNTGRLFYGVWYNQIVRNCFIVHNGQISSGFVIESCITTSSTSELTPTYVITHYSTYLCQTPHDLGSLDAPCQTFPEEYKECPTYFPEPTACDVITANAEHSFIILSSLIRIMMVSLINIY